MEHKFFVERAETLTTSTLLLTLNRDKDAGIPFDFHQGQYAAISFKHHKLISPARCFSIVSSPTNQTQLQFSMRVRGRFTSALQKLKKGDEVTVRGPFGGFVFDTDRYNKSLFIAGGIGITPFMSMIDYLSTIQFPHKITLIYGVQNQDDIPFLDQLRSFMKQNSKLRIIFAVSTPPMNKLTGLEVLEGRVTQEVIESAIGNDLADITTFICGPPPFMGAVQQQLKDLSVPSSRIITEVFNQGPHRQTGKVVSWPKNMYFLGGLGLAMGSLAIMIGDIVKTLPTDSLAREGQESPLFDVSEREKDIDQLVNDLPSKTAKTTNSPKLANVLKKVKQAQQKIARTNQSISQNTTGATPKIATSPTVLTPAPQPQPVCTTSQSGVTVCN